MILEIVLIVLVAGVFLALHLLWPRRIRLLKEAMTAELELCDQLKLMMDDMESRDPQLAEHMQLGRITVDQIKRDLNRSLVAIEILHKAGLKR